MLQKLIIKNVALIESVEIIFTQGLNVLSGETGSGKSVILESLNFALGAKADKSLIRSGESECFVSAIFNVENNQSIQELFIEQDFDQDEQLIISRKFTVDGKNSIKINGNSVTVSMLKKFTSKLVDLHGQSEHYQLLSSVNQLKLIDKLGGESINALLENTKKVYADYKNVVNHIESLGGDEAQRLVKLDVLNFQINEIESASLYEGEEEELLSLRAKILHQERILNALNSVKSAISDEGGVSDIISNATKNMSQIVDIDEKFSNIYERLNSIYAEIDDICEDVSDNLDDVEEVEQDPDKIEYRLDVIKSLKKKYGGCFEDICIFLDNAKKEKEALVNFEKNHADLQAKKQELQKKLYDLYVNLSNLRKESAVLFCKNVVEELKSLGMTKANFTVNFAPLPLYDDCLYNSANGIDDITFMFSANNGEPLKPLSNVISGGEMSRFMLSIKAQSAKVNDISTFVFDEIDAGISGNVARIVAEKFAIISKNVQVIAITHLPQISSMADNNLLIEKLENNDKTITIVKQLTEQQKIDEIIRLVGGKESESAKQLAIELIEKSTQFKNYI